MKKNYQDVYENDVKYGKLENLFEDISIIIFDFDLYFLYLGINLIV